MTTNDWWNELFTSIDSKQAKTFAAFLTEDAVFRYGSGPEVQGRTAITAFVDQVFESFRSCAHEIEHRWELDGCRICEGRVTYTRLDGKHVTLPFCNVLHMRGAFIARYEIFIDPTPLFARE